MTPRSATAAVLAAVALAAVALEACSAKPARVAIDPRGAPESVAYLAVRVESESGTLAATGLVRRDDGAPIELPLGEDFSRATKLSVFGLAAAQLADSIRPPDSELAAAILELASGSDPLIPAPVWSARAELDGEGFERLVPDDPPSAPELTAAWLPRCHTVIFDGTTARTRCLDAGAQRIACEGARAAGDLAGRAKELYGLACDATVPRFKRLAAESFAACTPANDEERGMTRPEVQILFPPEGAVTDTRAIHVSGTARHAVAISKLELNGETITSTRCFAPWSTNLVLRDGENELSADVLDVLGNHFTRTATRTVEQRGLITLPFDLAYDAEHDRVFVSERRAIHAVDLATQKVALIAGGDVTAQPFTPSGMAVDTARQRLIFADIFRGLFAVDLPTGLVTAISIGGGEDVWSRAERIAIDPERRRVLVTLSATRFGGGQLLSVDLDSGVPGDPFSICPSRICETPLGVAHDGAGHRMLVLTSSAAIYVLNDRGTPPLVGGCGAELAGRGPPRDLAIDTAHHAALFVAGPPPSALFSVDLSSGACTLISGQGAGRGEPLGRAAALAFDSRRGTAIVADGIVQGLLSVDLGTGVRTRFFSTSRGAGDPFQYPSAMAYDGRSAFVADRDAESIVRVDLPGGDRALISGPGRGAGPSVPDLEGIALDPRHGRLLVTGGDDHSVFTVDPASGDRALFSGPGRGAGPGLLHAGQIAVAPAGDRAFICDRGQSAIVAVELASGDRSVLSSPASGITPLLVPRHIVATSEYLAVTDAPIRKIFRVNAVNGARSDLIDSAIDGPSWIAIDEPSGRAVVFDPEAAAMRVFLDDVTTSAVFTHLRLGNGPRFDFPAGVALLDSTTVLVAASASKQLIAVDLSSGDRVLVSR